MILKRERSSLRTFLLATLFFQCAIAEAQGKVGYVLDRTGSWALSEKSTWLSPGVPVPAGALLRNPHPADNDQIVIVDLDWKIIKEVRCRNGVCNECRMSGQCIDAIRPLPSSPSQVGALSASFQAAMELLFGKPARYSIHRARGLGYPADALLGMADSNCDLAPVFVHLPKGTYRIRFQTLQQIANVGELWESEPVRLNWNPDLRRGYISVLDLHPGLYRLVLQRDGPAPLQEAWVLLTAPEDYARLAFVFQQASGSARSWTKSVSADTIQGYLRAVLEYESTQMSGDRGANR